MIDVIELPETVTSNVSPVPFPVCVEVTATPVNVPSVNVVPDPDVLIPTTSPNEFVTPCATLEISASVILNLLFDSM